MVEPRVILDSQKFGLVLERLCHQLIENHDGFGDTCLIGIQPRGIHLSRRIDQTLLRLTGERTWQYGVLDPTFYRDDFRRRDMPLKPAETRIDFLVEGKDVVLIDDVFYTGRTIRAAMDGLLHYGRPARVELLVLIDRRLSRHLPVQPDYVGQTVDAVISEQVRVEWAEAEGQDKVWIVSQNAPSV
ncbi:MAG: bifunctional pyr operon transcriptional regulator/uracil phosphoribosyltransferase PyrR [Bacteroidetes bacterium]|nr:bifunctional pyr operon transcriptional regulator/uracil phosphoribosyltransferase PyrR [Bacteroidota bacterium]